MDRRWLVPIVLALSLVAWYAMENAPGSGQTEPAAREAAPESRRVAQNVPYAELAGTRHVVTSLDVYAAPSTDPLGPLQPVVVMIHGGGWRFGDKANEGVVGHKPAWLTDRGFVYVPINYRLTPGASHPSQIEDVAAAVAWVRRHIANFGGDPERIILVGHSAGAHLAALAAMHPEYLPAAGVPHDSIAGVVLIDGAGYDLPRALSTMHSSRLREWTEAAFGTDPDGLREASPITHVGTSPTMPPVLLLHTTHRTAPAEQAQALSEAVRNHGGVATVYAVDDKSHLSIMRDLGEPGDPLTAMVEVVLDDWTWSSAD
jgi:arylformamidase